MPLLQEAVAWYVAGYMPLPVKPDGSKAPAVKTWTDYQKERPPLAEVVELFKIDSDGIGLVCGEISGGLEMLELEGRAMAEGYLDKIIDAFEDHGMQDLWSRIQDGYLEGTPSGGLHYYYRVNGYSKRNTKLARRPATPDELAINPDEKLKVLIETRAEGGFTVIAPSAGRTHSSGKPWQSLVTNYFEPSQPRGHWNIPVITPDERDAIHAIASTLDQVPVQEPPPPSRGGLTAVPGNELRPGDDYNARATWKDILEPHGWTCHKHYGGNLYGWRKPGKTHPGISATTGRNDADRLFVFSTSTVFDSERPYSKFSAYALLEHGGDFGAAARALRHLGFGERSAADHGGSGGAVPRSQSEQLAHLLRGVANAERLHSLQLAQLDWAARQILQNHRHVPDVFDLLHEAARDAGLPDVDIKQTLTHVRASRGEA